MRGALASGVLGLVLSAGPLAGQTEGSERHNPVIALLEQGRPVFGLYQPSAGGGRDGSPPRSAAEVARETLTFGKSDFVFNGSMEGGVQRGLPPFLEYVAALRAAGASARTHPLVIKTEQIAPDPDRVAADIGRQLNSGASGIMLVEAESAEEVRRGIAAMRFRSKGGTRPDDVGNAPAWWGMSDEDYSRKADLWPLNPEGELINWTIIESREGLANVREIAAVPGIGVLWPGAGTLRGVFTTTDAQGNRVFDADGWEAAIQTVLAACREFGVPCGYPANANDIETRLAQGFSVFVMGWGEAGFDAVEIGRRAAGR